MRVPILGLGVRVSAASVLHLGFKVSLSSSKLEEVLLAWELKLQPLKKFSKIIITNSIIDLMIAIVIYFVSLLKSQAK